MLVIAKIIVVANVISEPSIDCHPHWLVDVVDRIHQVANSIGQMYA